MGFLAGTFDKSVFNRESYGSAIGKGDNNGYAVVRIIPNSNRLMKKDRDPSIKGVYDASSGGLSFNIEANWADLGGIGGAVLPTFSNKIKGAIEKSNQAASVGGLSNIGAGLTSQLIYQKSGYLTIKVPMIIVDWDGIGQPIISSLLLSRYCLPDNIYEGEDIKRKAKELREAVEQGVEKLQEKLNEMATSKDSSLGERAVGTAGSFAAEGVEVGKDYTQKLKEYVSDNVPALREAFIKSKENIGSIDDAFILRASPTSVTVEIGQYFSNNDMIIKGVDFEFSKEMTEAGPLFVKVNLDLSTRRILTDLSSVGLHGAQKKSRYLSVQGNTLLEDRGSNATGL